MTVRPRSATALLTTFVLSTCVGSEPPAERPAGAAQSPPASGTFPGRSYERNFVFTTVSGDSAFLVPWLLETTTRPGTVVREAHAWMARGGMWEGFFAERWETPPTRTPARVLPHGAFRIVVREGDAVDGIIFEEGPRNLEIGLGSVLAEWDGPRGQVFQLLEGSLYLQNQRIGGLVLDMARGSSAESPRGGDWAFLTSGDSVQLVLEGTAEHDPTTPPSYLGWARLDFRDLRWNDLEVTWAETSAFHPARRDVPTRWTVRAPDGDLEATLDVESTEIEAGEGEGPVLPLRALYEVTGTVTLEGRAFPVRGLLTHERR